MENTWLAKCGKYLIASKILKILSYQNMENTWLAKYGKYLASKMWKILNS